MNEELTAGAAGIGVVDLAGQVAVGVVGVGRVGAVAVELFVELAEAVVGVLDDQCPSRRSVGQPAQRVVAVVDACSRSDRRSACAGPGRCR